MMTMGDYIAIKGLIPGTGRSCGVGAFPGEPNPQPV